MASTAGLTDQQMTDFDQNPDASPAQKMHGATHLLANILDELEKAAPEKNGTGDRAFAATVDESRADASGADGGQDAVQGSATASLGDVLDRLDERAFGFLLLLLALPCCVPFIYLLPQIVSLPMLALAGQLAAGKKHPWFPAKIKTRRFLSCV